MNPTTIDFIFCKIHIHNNNLFQYETMEQLMEDIEKAQSISFKDKSDNIWHIGGVINHQVGKSKLLSGKLGKVHSKKIADWDENKKDFVDKWAERDANFCHFIIDADSYVMAIENKLLISPQTFIKRFLYFIPDEKKRTVSIDFMLQKGNVYERVKSWQNFFKAAFDLRPSNPDSDPDFSELDKLVIDSKSAKAKLTFTGNDLAKEGTIIQQGIAMASAGYGDFLLRGKQKDGTVDKINSKSFRLIKGFDVKEAMDMVENISTFIKTIRQKDGRDKG